MTTANAALAGMAALVTGGGGAIGRACARALVRDGASVTLLGRTDATLAAARDELLALRAAGAEVSVCVGDAGRESDVAAAVEQASRATGRLEICVATVGGGDPLQPLLMHDAESFLGNVSNNLLPPFLAVRHAAPRIAAAGGGSIVCISSDAAKLVFPYLSTYCTGKAALETLVRCAAEELGGANVRVNAVRPGLTRAGSTQGIFADAELVGRFAAEKPLGRTGEPDDIAAGVRYLAGPESSWVTGQSFAIEGGNELRKAPDLEAFVRNLHGDAVVDAAKAGRVL